MIGVPLNKEQYVVLSAMAQRRPHTLWPVMRRLFLRRQYIQASGDYPAPSERSRCAAPVRPYVVLQAGLDAIAAYELRTAPVPRGPLKMDFRKDPEMKPVVTVADLTGDIETKLAGLTSNFRIERSRRTAAFPTVLDDQRICRYCRMDRKIYAGTMLDGHARCVVSDGFKRYLGDVMRDPRLTYDRVAKALEVSVITVRTWFRTARAA